MDRRANIDQINSRYSRSPQPVSSIVTPLTTLATGSTTIRRSRIQTSTIGANQISGPRVITSTLGNTTLGVNGVVGERLRTSFVGGRTIGGTEVSGGINTLRTSKIITPPLYETVTHPPVYETITTPTKVYQIVTPIIDITPAISTLETTKIGGQGRLWSRKDRQSGCPWWCLLLLCLLLTLFLLGGLLYLYKHCIGNNKEQIVEPIVQPITPIETKQPQPTQQPEPVPVKQPEPVQQPEPKSIKPQPQPQPQPKQQQKQEQKKQQKNKQQQKKQEQHVPAKTPHCRQGTLLHNGRCLKCPAESTWNGNNCIKRVITKTKTVQYKSEGQSSGDNEIGSEKSQKSQSKNSQQSSKEGQNTSSQSQQKSEQNSEQKQTNQKKQTTQNEGEQSKQSEHKNVNIRSH